MKFYLFLLVVGVLVSVCRVRGVSLKDYCKHDKSNTPCRTECYRSQWCGTTKDGFALLSDDEREMVLKKHNTLRNEAAKGDHEGKNLPKCAGGIKALSYDKELEFLAGCHIKACDFNHDKVRLTAAGKKAGQNLHMKITGKDIGFSKTFLEDGVQSWFEEYKKLGSSAPIKSFGGAKGIGHLTAILWGKTEYVGCAKFHYIQSSKHYYSLFCNYLPAGNMKGSPVYADGDCGDKNGEYGDLCGKIRAIADDSYTAPIDLSGGCIFGAWSMVVVLIWNIFIILL